MYKIIKEKGNNSNIILENMDTNASIIIGKITISILDILKDEGYELCEDDKGLKIKDRWELKVSDEAAKAISHKALTMSKPIKAQVKNDKTEQVSNKKDNKKVDAMDVLLGLASYN